ncbi:HdeD family acid-resistance protein [bacterium]|nr:HdeD family acid-resistance protein [bacterium]
MEHRLAAVLCRNWWVLLLRGLVAIAFGVLAWLQPGISLAALVLLFGAYALADGLLSIAIALAGRRQDDNWWLLLIEGLLGVLVGILAFAAPAAMGLAILFCIAAWAILTGFLKVVVAIALRKETTGEWRLIVAGVVSVLFGAILMAQPSASAIALLWVIALYAVLFGLLLVLLAFKVRGLGRLFASPDAVGPVPS